MPIPLIILGGFAALGGILTIFSPGVQEDVQQAGEVWGTAAGAAKGAAQAASTILPLLALAAVAYFATRKR